ncbi:hypothetical protein [Crucivirus sp.]|nr:hypothetical protein [Crucivirus sp.]
MSVPASGWHYNKHVQQRDPYWQTNRWHAQKHAEGIRDDHREYNRTHMSAKEKAAAEKAKSARLALAAKKSEQAKYMSNWNSFYMKRFQDKAAALPSSSSPFANRIPQVPISRRPSEDEELDRARNARRLAAAKVPPSHPERTRVQPKRKRLDEDTSALDSLIDAMDSDRHQEWERDLLEAQSLPPKKRARVEAMDIDYAVMDKQKRLARARDLTQRSRDWDSKMDVELSRQSVAPVNQRNYNLPQLSDLDARLGKTEDELDALMRRKYFTKKKPNYKNLREEIGLKATWLAELHLACNSYHRYFHEKTRPIEILGRVPSVAWK